MAAALVDERGIEHVSMDDVAAAASVGTGTLYRRFGDRAGLALALLDEHEARVPGGAPARRAAARARAPRRRAPARVRRGLHRPRSSATPTSRRRRAARAHRHGGPYSLYATHLALLLREAAPHVDAEFAAQALLAALRPAQHLYGARGLDWSLERVRAGWRDLVDALSAGPRAGR